MYTRKNGVYKLKIIYKWDYQKKELAIGRQFIFQTGLVIE